MREERDGLKVTAYALGELGGDEGAAVEAKIAASVGARREVEEIRAAAAALREAYRSMPRHELTPEQRLAVEAAAAREPGVPAPTRRFPGLLRMAASFAAAAGVAAAILAVTTPHLLRARLAAPQRAAGTPAPAGVAGYSRPQPRIGTLGRKQNEPLRELGYVGGEMERDDLQRLRESSAPFNTEAYDHISDNPFLLVAHDPRSTFSVDVDTASYAIVRRFLNGGDLPPKDAVRIEELINYF